MDLSPTQTTFEPQDLKFLQECFDAIRSQRGLVGDDRVATDLAAQMIELYQSGVRDRQELGSRINL